MIEWSIIIPAFNEEKHIYRCLESISRLDYRQEAIEVVVVDNGSRDQTLSIVECFSPQIGIRILSRPKLNVGALRNAGVDASQGQFLAFVDADCAVEPNWLKRGAEILGQHPGAVVGAPYALPPDAGWPARVWHRRFHAHKRGETSYVPGGNMLMEDRLFHRIGGFDPALRSNEDSQFCSRARALGISVLAFRELAATHFGAEKDLLHFIRRQFWHGCNILNAAGLKGNLRVIALAAFTFTCAFATILSGLMRQPWLALSSFLGLLLAPAIVALAGVKGESQYRDLPRLFILLSTYSLVRAAVLPVAVVRALSPKQR